MVRTRFLSNAGKTILVMVAILSRLPNYYNFVRIHKTLRVTPAMAAGVTDWLWEIADIAKLVEDAEAAQKARGPYKRRGGIR